MVCGNVSKMAVTVQLVPPGKSVGDLLAGLTQLGWLS